MGLWLKEDDYVKVIGFQVKALYSLYKCADRPPTSQELWYILSRRQLEKAVEKHKKSGVRYIFFALPRYYENYLDAIGATIFDYVSPEELMNYARKYGIVRDDQYQVPYTPPRTGGLKYRAYSFGKLFRDLFRCVIGIKFSKDLFQQEITSRTIFRKIVELVDPTDELVVSLLLIVNFTRMIVLFVAPTRDFITSYA